MISFNKIIDIAAAMRDENEIGGRINHHVSFVVYKNRIISIGKNNHKTHPINLYNPKLNRSGEDISESKKTCSELSAIIKLKNTSNIPFNKCSLINIRISRNNEVALAKPCSSCISLLKYINFKNVFYTDDDGAFKEFKYS